MRDLRFTAVLLIYPAEAKPMYEAEALQPDLLRAGTQPYGCVINGSLVNLDVEYSVLAARKTAKTGI